MSSKKYFTLSGIFMLVYIITSFGVLVSLPNWLHQVSTIFFAIFAYLGYQKKKNEKDE